MLFDVKGLTKSFGGLVAVRELSMQIDKGQIRGLIGPNGAGKTTTFNLVSGYYKPDAGEILLGGQEISGLNMSAIAKRGIVRTFQATTLFHELTVLENVIAGRALHTRSNLISALFGSARANERENEEKALEILEFLGLADRKDEVSANLPHGHQKALGIGIALAAEPKLLMLDEPFAGMNAEETNKLMELIRAMRDRGYAILLVEHDMKAVMGLCERITVLNFGQYLFEGAPDEVINNESVIEAYLGGG